MSTSPREGPDYKTLRADIALGDFKLSASSSRGTSFFGTPLSVESAGAIWQRDIERGTVFVGGGYERGPEDRFNSISFGMKTDSLNVMFSRIHRKPLVVTGRTSAAYDTTYLGTSISFNFGDYTLGAAIAHQDIDPRGENVFAGQARALWVAWEARENVTAHFEVSESEYLYAGGDDTKKASFAVSLEFCFGEPAPKPPQCHALHVSKDRP